jgi:hypothetical protein
VIVVWSAIAVGEANPGVESAGLCKHALLQLLGHAGKNRDLGFYAAMPIGVRVAGDGTRTGRRSCVHPALNDLDDCLRRGGFVRRNDFLIHEKVRRRLVAKACDCDRRHELRNKQTRIFLAGDRAAIPHRRTLKSLNCSVRPGIFWRSHLAQSLGTGFPAKRSDIQAIAVKALFAAIKP